MDTQQRTTLCVIGPHSGCGKTTFLAQLLRHVHGLGCLKISPAQGAPPGNEAGGRDYWLHNAASLRTPGKDTALYLDAGAVHVERLRHKGEGLAPGLCAALARFPDRVPIVVESSSAVRFLTPVAVVLVVRPPLRELKPSTSNVLHLVTDLVVNAPDRPKSSGEVERFRAAHPALRPEYTWSANLIAEPPPGEMVARLRALLFPKSG